MIIYSAEAESARAYLLKNYNDIDIFVEDATCQNMYIRLFNQMLGSKGKINQVFPLHGRPNVIARCAADQGSRDRRRLYVIDADHDLLLGISSPRLRYLYRLKSYCSENLLLSEYAALMLAMESRSNASWVDLQTELDLQKLLSTSSQQLLPLFVTYAIVNKLDLSITTVDFSVLRLLNDKRDPCTLSDHLIRTRVISVLRKIRAVTTYRQCRAVLDSILRRLRHPTAPVNAYVSGKDCLLPLVHLQLQKVAKFHDSFEGLKVRLAMHCELSADPGLRRAIRKALQ